MRLRDLAMDGLTATAFTAVMRNCTNHHDTTLVLGATGKTGRRIRERLEARGVPVRAGSRSGRPPFDWERADTWPAMLDGTSNAYISFYPDIAVPGAAEAVGTFARLAAERDVRRLVLLSGRGEEEAQRAEALVRDAFADATVVRCSWFMQNFSESFLVGPVLEGEVVLPVDGMAEPFVDAEDIAEVAVAALLEDGHAGRTYELTGPRLLRFHDAVAEIAAATGRPMVFASVRVDAFAHAMSDAGEPDEVVALLTYLFTEVLDGRNAHLADGVQQALGRPARDFAEYARRTAATGVWDAA